MPLGFDSQKICLSLQPPANRRAAGQQLTREGAVRRTGW